MYRIYRTGKLSSKWSQNRFVYSHGADSQRIVENRTAVLGIVPGKVFSQGADSKQVVGKVYSHGAYSQRFVEDKTAVFVEVPRKVYSHGADSQRIIGQVQYTHMEQTAGGCTGQDSCPPRVVPE
jgi:hypothetical protein